MLRGIPGTGLYDMTSQGYGGPLTSATMPSPVDGIVFDQHFAAWRKENRVVAEFYLLCPAYMTHQSVLLPAAELVPEREVFFVHLGSDEEIEAGLTKSRIQVVNRARGAQLDPLLGVSEFFALYNDAMIRKDASARWRFAESHFLRLKAELRDKVAIIGTRDGTGALKAAAMFVRGGGMAHYYLAATAEDRLSGYNDICLLAGMTAARAVNCEWLSLGGGLSADGSDTLAFYKRSFGSYPRMLYSVRRVHDQLTYDLLSKPHNVGHFFPAYRAEPA
jgi:hypothetical protein